ncbi:MAG TPA: hypothetical protein VNJ28_02230, partial [Candidatus Limnocylindrales bacterium]|nr:hypothetical protein [Candidatus Limnocylindrales bacterium]
MDDIERTDVADRAEPTGLAETSELTELVPGETSLRIPVDDAVLDADLGVPEAARPGFGRTGTGLVVFAHGSGSSRLSPRNRYVARALREAGLATLLFDLLTPDEEEIDLATRTIRFDIGLLAERLVGVTDWLARMPATREMAIGYFGASTG